MCNRRLALNEDVVTDMIVLHRFLAYLAFAFMALLPLEASYAALGCPPMTRADATLAGDCGGCADADRIDCRSSCLALCHSLPVAGAVDLAAPDFIPARLSAAFTQFAASHNIGPEPPPPRALR